MLAQPLALVAIFPFVSDHLPAKRLVTGLLLRAFFH
jgi:hypothetical protein